ncbi:hypothetical protein [Thiocystis violascens]|uniref:Uncharacterized protein n=1 Tax=Thiocystis violascens (strain ATCC 17096 / DSM 198 / 6111) TaxID=765911 RepID=I3Y5K0_THIV6|nr:hypothetical protein [Thiocystis violascens]AFL72268.1 hypothetical protein Thivi_0197 [Thiocystis violascens DSM 198]
MTTGEHIEELKEALRGILSELTSRMDAIETDASTARALNRARLEYLEKREEDRSLLEKLARSVKRAETATSKGKFRAKR